MLRIIFTQLFALLFTAGAVFAQQTTLTLQENSEMSIEGSSNVRSWGAEVTSMEGTLTLNTDELSPENLSPDMFGSLQITAPVKSLDSGSGGLTNNIHKYLKEKDHPNITFTLSEVTNIEQRDGQAEITAIGVINAAGNDHEVTMTVLGEQADNGLRISGSQELLMTSFDIDPPRAMLGTIRADDEFKVNFDVQFNK